MILVLLLLGCPATVYLDTDGKYVDSGDDTSETGVDTMDTNDSDTGETGTETGDSGDDSDTSETGDTADTSVVYGPCSDGTWGNASDESIVVLEDGDDSSADGTLSAPFSTIVASKPSFLSNTATAVFVMITAFGLFAITAFTDGTW
jgi:hypothetical protein